MVRQEIIRVHRGGCHRQADTERFGLCGGTEIDTGAGLHDSVRVHLAIDAYLFRGFIDVAHTHSRKRLFRCYRRNGYRGRRSDRRYRCGRRVLYGGRFVMNRPFTLFW